MNLAQLHQFRKVAAEGNWKAIEDLFNQSVQLKQMHIRVDLSQHKRPAAERPDADYPLVLITGRQLEHWHTGSMTRRSGVLDAIEPDPVALLHPLELERLGLAPGDLLTLQTRRGEVSLWARADATTPEGAVFVAFCWAEAAVNRLTHAALDPVAKIPEFKYCAARIRPGGETPQAGTLGGGRILQSAVA